MCKLNTAAPQSPHPLPQLPQWLHNQRPRRRTEPVHAPCASVFTVGTKAVSPANVAHSAHSHFYQYIG